MSHELSERPAEAGARSRVGDWEGDTVAGRAGGACLVTMVDRMSGYLAGRKSPSKRKGRREGGRWSSRCAATPWRPSPWTGAKEFAEHALFTEAVGAECYFCPPHHPWDRGTNENTQRGC